MITLDPEDFPGLDSEQVAELQATVARMERVMERREARRRGRELNRGLPSLVDQSPPYPPDPCWGTDDRGRFRYVDYDGESLHIRYEEDGDIWVDKMGEGPVYIRAVDIPVVIEALRAGG